MEYSNMSAKGKFLTQHWNNHDTMVKYTIAMLQPMVSAELTRPLDKIHEPLIFSTLWHLQRQLVDNLHKLGNVKSPLDNHVGYIVSKEAFGLFLSTESRDTKEVS